MSNIESKVIDHLVSIINASVGRSKEEKIAAITALGYLGGDTALDVLINITNAKVGKSVDEKISAINALGFMNLED